MLLLPSSTFALYIDRILSDVSWLEVAKLIREQRLEYLPCALCGSEKYTVLIRGIASGDLVRCDSCGLCRANPRYTDHLIFGTMGKHYAPILAVDKVQDKEALWANWRYRLWVIERWISKGRMLDVGCYAGTFLAVAGERGWTLPLAGPPTRATSSVSMC